MSRSDLSFASTNDDVLPQKRLYHAANLVSRDSAYREAQWSVIVARQITEQRMKYAGVLFYVVFVLSILSTHRAIRFVTNSSINSGTLLIAVGLGAGIFTTEGIGFLFNNVVTFVWNRWFHGYSGEWRRHLTYDLKGETRQRYESIAAKSERITAKYHRTTANGEQIANDQWKEYEDDVFLSYFWQQAPPALVDWVSRRHTAFFLGVAGAFAIFLAFAISGLIAAFSFGWTFYTTMVLLISAALIVVFFYNAYRAKKEAWQMIDLWLRGASDERAAEAMKGIMRLFPRKPEN